VLVAPFSTSMMTSMSDLLTFLSICTSRRASVSTLKFKSVLSCLSLLRMIRRVLVLVVGELAVTAIRTSVVAAARDTTTRAATTKAVATEATEVAKIWAEEDVVLPEAVVEATAATTSSLTTTEEVVASNGTEVMMAIWVAGELAAAIATTMTTTMVASVPNQAINPSSSKASAIEALAAVNRVSTRTVDSLASLVVAAVTISSHPCINKRATITSRLKDLLSKLLTLFSLQTCQLTTLKRT